MKIAKNSSCVEGTAKSSLHYRQRKFFKPLNALWEYRQNKVFQDAPKEHNLFIKAVPVSENKEIHLFGSNTIEGFWDYYDKLPSSDRVHYEIIRSGRPCKAVIDLEWDKIKKIFNLNSDELNTVKEYWNEDLIENNVNKENEDVP